MKIEKVQEHIQKTYNLRYRTLQKRVAHAIESAQSKGADLKKLNLNEMKSLSAIVLNIETAKTHSQVEALLAKKEKLQTELDQKLEKLQEIKYDVFHAIEEHISQDDALTLSKLHQVKLQSVDIFDLLGYGDYE